jgi:mono/diheme cytochrome c family protein
MRNPTLTALLLATLVACGDKDDDTASDTGHDHGDHDTDGDTDTDTGAGTGDAANGQTVYMATCGSDYCHGSDGASGSAPDHPDVVPTLSDDQLRTIMNEGQGYMGPQELSAQEVEDVLAYLRATFG